MPLNWSKLAPHRPLGPGDPLYVRRPEGGGDELAEWIKAGVETVAIAGPVGSGKSTELACAAARLQGAFVVVQVALDRLLDMHMATEGQVFLQVATRVTAVAQGHLHLDLSDALVQKLSQAHTEAALGIDADRDILLGALREVAAASRQGGVVLLLDGLEKCDAQIAVRIVRALLEAREDARLAFIVPYSAVVGSGAYELVANVDRTFFIRALPVLPEPDKISAERYAEAEAFLRELIRVRLDRAGLPVELADLLTEAAKLSGGVPRSFLQLVRAMASYAALEGRDMPTRHDFSRAAHDHEESLALLLVDGDIGWLRAVDGTSGVEIPEGRRLRLLMHGLLLEYKTDSGPMVRPAPLLRSVLRGSA